jgi:hypothetical protein
LKEVVELSVIFFHNQAIPPLTLVFYHLYFFNKLNCRFCLALHLRISVKKRVLII